MLLKMLESGMSSLANELDNAVVACNSRSRASDVKELVSETIAEVFSISEGLTISLLFHV